MLQDAKIKALCFSLLPIAIFAELWYNIYNIMKQKITDADWLTVLEQFIQYNCENKNSTENINLISL